MRKLVLLTLFLLHTTLCYGAVNVSVGSITAPLATGNQETNITPSFQPKVVIFMGTNATADGTAADADMHFGVGISSTSRRAINMMDDDALATTNTYAQSDNTSCIWIATRTDLTIAKADMVSLDADGFTINWTTVDAALQPIVPYLALGGDITNVYLGSGTSATATGNKAYTGIGFQPDAIIFFYAGRSTTETTVADGTRWMMGLATTSTARGYNGSQSVDGNAAATTGGVQLTSKCMAIIGTASATSAEADFVSMDADGFTLNWTTVDTSAYYFYYLAIKGGSWKVGSFNSATSTGNQATTGVGFQPDGMFYMSRSLASSATFNVDTDSNHTLGIAKSSTARATIWSGSADAADPMTTDNVLDRANAIRLVDAGTPTNIATADYVSNDTNGFTVNWTAVNGTARENLYLAFGTVAVTRREYLIQ